MATTSSGIVWSSSPSSSFHTTSAYQLQSSNRSSAGESAGSVGGYAVVSSSPLSSFSSFSSSMRAVSSKTDASLIDNSSSETDAAFSSSFYSTSAYRLQSVRGVSGNIAVNRSSGVNATAQVNANADFVPQADLAYMTQATPRDMSMAQVNNFFAMADDMYAQYLSADAGQSKMYASSRRPDDGPSIGELTPVGDAVLPLLACVAAYAVYKIRRVINLKKARTL
ncbi:MAG: hypothetical protein ACI4TV_04200 [Paludibacteraceae bacterium]